MSVEAELLAIHAEQGGITPERVLEAAKEPASDLHKRFTWDDTEAAVRWRLTQAGAIIRQFKITVTEGEDKMYRLRALTHLPGLAGERGTYVPTREALADPAKRQVAFAEAVKALAQLRRKYQHLVDFDAAIKAERERFEAAAQAHDEPEAVPA